MQYFFRGQTKKNLACSGPKNVRQLVCSRTEVPEQAESPQVDKSP